jgi:hypothetical protein
MDERSRQADFVLTQIPQFSAIIYGLPLQNNLSPTQERDVTTLPISNRSVYFNVSFLNETIVKYFFIWFVRLLALRPLLAYCASLG